jgi:outer membrane immunogenic protein
LAHRARWLAVSVLSVAATTAEAQQVLNPTVLEPSAKPPPARTLSTAVSRRRGLEAPPGADKKFVTVRAVAIAGAFPELAEENAAFARQVEGRRLSLAEIYRAAGELQAAYSKAFPLAILSAPRPDFADGVVRLEAIDGVIEKIQISGVPEATQQLVRARLEPLLGQRHLTADEYQRRTRLVGTIAGVGGQASTAPGGGVDGYVLNVEVNEKRIAASSAITNRLPKEFGTWELSQSVALLNALGFGEQISVSALSSTDVDRFFDGTGKSQAYMAEVVAPVGFDGLTVGADYLSARSRAAPLFTSLTPNLIDAGERLTGRFDRVRARVGYPLFLTGNLTTLVQTIVEHINNRNRYEPYPLGFVDPTLYGFSYPVSDVARDRYTVARFSAEGKYRVPWLDNAYLSGLVAYGRGLGGRLDSADYVFGPPLSRFGASPVFNRLNLKGRLDVGLPEQFIVTAIGRFQTSFGEPLVLPENFLLDGPEGVSGYASGTLNVDRGVTARAELSRPFVLQLLDYNHIVAPYIFGAWGEGVREIPAPSPLRRLRAETFGGGVRADTNFTGSPYGESLAIEFGRDYSNIPFRETGYRTNVSFNMRYAGNPLAPDATPVSTAGVLKKGPPAAPAPTLWQGFYAGLNVGYSWDPLPLIATSGAPLTAGIDSLFPPGFEADPPYWAASLAGAKGRSLAAGGGFVGGGQAGYNIQAGGFVFGLETDIQGANARTRHGLWNGNYAYLPAIPDVDFVYSTVNHTKNVDWLGTARGRVGYLVAPTLLGYATGGLAYGDARASSFVRQNWALGGPLGALLQSSGSTGGFSGLLAGWTIGGGLEWMFAPGASVKAEYLHYDLGSVTYGLTPLTTLFAGIGSNVVAPVAQTQFRGDIARLGLNYHFGQSGFAESSLIKPAAFASGFYAGLNSGYSWDSSPNVATAAIPAGTGLDQALLSTFGPAAAASAAGVARTPASGAFGGGQTGYNYRLDRYVAGVEADLQGAAMSGRGGYAGVAPGTIAGAPLAASASSAQIEKTLDWFGTLRLRGGYLVTPSILAYGTGGFAYGGATLENRVANLTDAGAINLQSMSSIGALSTGRVGWTVGGGLEWKFAPAMSLKAEYLHYDLGRVQYGSGAVATSLFAAFTNTALLTSATRFSGEMARLGFNYHFEPAEALPLLGE